MADISLWQQSLEQSDDVFDPRKIATDLYQCSRELFFGVLKVPAHESYHAFLQDLRHQAHRFSLWGSSFEAQDGGLDKRLVGADELKETLLPLLGSMGDALVIIAQHLGISRDLAELCSRARSLKGHISDVTGKPGLGGFGGGNELLPAELLDQLDSSDSEDLTLNETVELEELLQDIRSYNTCLLGLSGVLQKPAESVSVDLGKSKEEIRLAQDLLANTAWPYISSVMQVYPLIDSDFARRLGEANELRYNRLQSQRDQAAARGTGIEPESSNEDVTTIIRPTESVDQPSSSLEQSESTAASTQLSSVFDYMRKTPDRKRYRQPTIAASVTTFESSPEGKDLQQHSRGFPKMPEGQPWGTPFKCTVCGEVLSNVWSPAQWV